MLTKALSTLGDLVFDKTYLVEQIRGFQSMLDINIRNGKAEDIPALLALIKELAAFEREPHAVAVTEEELLNDGFGDHPAFHFLVAEIEEEVVGIALFYFAYSTWKGKYLYLEDFVVKDCHRSRGIGRRLFEAVVNIAEEQKVRRMGWQVLNWNKDAIRFYERYNADLSDEWLNGRLYFE